MKREKDKKRKLHKGQYRVIICFLLSFVLLCVAGWQLFAKYYAGQSNKGVATASSLYFSSNVLKTLTDDIYPSIYNTTAWDGTTACKMDIQIRNYQNQLLYNDANLDITYNITFQLVGTSDGGTYQVTEGTNDPKIITESGITFSDRILKGGRIDTDLFQVSITRPDSQSSNANYRSVGIRVTAIPVSPSYVTSSATLGGVLYASMLSADYSLKYSFEKVSSVYDFSGFPCVISYTPGEDNAAHEIEIRWDYMLEIDQFDPYYQQAVANGNYGEDSNDGSHYIQITMQPYSTIQIAFYRSDAFSSGTVQLSSCVHVTDITRSSEGSGN